MTNQNNIPGEKLEKILALAELFQLQDKHKPVFDESGNTFTTDEVVERAKDKCIRANYVENACAKYFVSTDDSIELMNKNSVKPSLYSLLKIYQSEVLPVLNQAFPNEEFEIDCPKNKSNHSGLKQFYVYSVIDSNSLFRTRKIRTPLLNICFYYGNSRSDTDIELKGSESIPNISIAYSDPRVFVACEKKFNELKRKLEDFIDAYTILAE